MCVRILSNSSIVKLKAEMVVTTCLVMPTTCFCVLTEKKIQQEVGLNSWPHPYLYLLAKDSLQVYCVVNDRLKRRLLKTKINCIGNQGTGFSFLEVEICCILFAAEHRNRIHCSAGSFGGALESMSGEDLTRIWVVYSTGFFKGGWLPWLF